MPGASCSRSGQDGRLVRHRRGRRAGRRSRGRSPVGTVVGIDACDGRRVLVTRVDRCGHVARSRSRATTGAMTGRDRRRARLLARARWHATARGLDRARRRALHARSSTARRSRSALPPLGELLAKRGDRRLVRATPLDRGAARSRTACARTCRSRELGAVLGERSRRSRRAGSARRARPCAGSRCRRRYRRALRARRAGARRRGARRAARSAGRGRRSISRARSRSRTPAKHARRARSRSIRSIRGLYAIALEREPDEHDDRRRSRAFDLATRAWRGSAPTAAAPGTPVALAVAREVVVCAARGDARRDGARDEPRRRAALGLARRQRSTTCSPAGDVVLVRDARSAASCSTRATATCSATSRATTARAMRAAVARRRRHDDARRDRERGRVVARLARVGMVPAWSLAVAGVVRAIAPSARRRARRARGRRRATGSTRAPASRPRCPASAWRGGRPATSSPARPPGGPIPPSPMPACRRRPRPAAEAAPPAGDRRRRTTVPPPMSTPWPPPPPIGDSWQLTRSTSSPAGYARATTTRSRAPIAPARPRARRAARSSSRTAPACARCSCIDPRTGDPLRRVAPARRRAPDVFATIVDGKPVAGVVLAQPLRVVLF